MFRGCLDAFGVTACSEEKTKVVLCFFKKKSERNFSNFCKKKKYILSLVTVFLPACLAACVSPCLFANPN